MLPKAKGKQGSYPIPLNKDWKARVDNAGGAQALILRTYRWQDHDHRYTDDTPENRHSATCLLVSTRTESLRWSYWFGANRGPNTRLSTRRGWWYCTVKETRLRQIDLRRLVNASQTGGVERSECMIVTMPAPRMTSLRSGRGVHFFAKSTLLLRWRRYDDLLHAMDGRVLSSL